MGFLPSPLQQLSLPHKINKPRTMASNSTMPAYVFGIRLTNKMFNGKMVDEFRFSCEQRELLNRILIKKFLRKATDHEIETLSRFVSTQRFLMESDDGDEIGSKETKRLLRIVARSTDIDEQVDAIDQSSLVECELMEPMHALNGQWSSPFDLSIAATIALAKLAPRKSGRPTNGWRDRYFCGLLSLWVRFGGNLLTDKVFDNRGNQRSKTRSVSDLFLWLALFSEAIEGVKVDSKTIRDIHARNCQMVSRKMPLPSLNLCSTNWVFSFTNFR